MDATHWQHQARYPAEGVPPNPNPSVLDRARSGPDVRRLPIKRYPFTIFYRIILDDDRIDILRVIHSAAVRDLGKVPD